MSKKEQFHLVLKSKDTVHLSNDTSEVTRASEPFPLSKMCLQKERIT